jgi:hypothetical protein
MQPTETEEPGAKRNAPIWVKIFVPLHIIAITSWSLPYVPEKFMGEKPQVKLGIKTGSPKEFFQSTAEFITNEFLLANQLYVKQSPLKMYLLTTGYWQYWDMFSPNPASVDQYSDAVVYYKDGTKKKYQYPRIFTMSLGQKFMMERWRKYFERAGSKDYQYLWPVFGQRIALMNFDDPKNPPVQVELHRHEMVINPPGEPINHDYSDTMYWTYRVDLDALRKDKGL